MATRRVTSAVTMGRVRVGVAVCRVTTCWVAMTAFAVAVAVRVAVLG